jgi:hypothetical protein
MADEKKADQSPPDLVSPSRDFPGFIDIKDHTGMHKTSVAAWDVSAVTLREDGMTAIVARDGTWYATTALPGYVMQSVGQAQEENLRASERHAALKRQARATVKKS